ncbi:MAG: DUF1631 domain-containing protein [Usitatibacter sp.]
MAQAPSSNVVAMADARARVRLSPKESADMLTGCRELALTQITRALSGMLDRVEDHLFELAEKATDRDSQNIYLDARIQAREKRSLIESAFARHFTELFDRGVRGEGSPSAKSEPGELALLAEEDLEETLAMREMSSKLKASCEGELMALSQRMGFLLERPGLEDDANPMSPAAICAALRAACEQIEAGQKVRMTLLRQLERSAEDELQRIYRDVNSHLVERRILPEVRAGVPRSVPPSAPRPAKKAPAKGAVPGQGPAAAPDGDILAALAQLLAPGGASAGGSSGTGAAMASWPTAPGSASSAPTVPQSFMTELTRMHREPLSAQDAADGALMNVVRRIKAAPQSATLGTVDAMTIDIIAMLFDNIFEDPHIPSRVKALLGRLQIPTLKVALLDKSFFSSKAHPARRLLDLLAQSAIGLDEASPREGPALLMIEGVVDRVLAEFETDLALFDEMAQRVAAFIEQQKSAEGEIVERSARLIEERERDQIAREIAEQEVARRLESRAWVPPVLREMLVETWVRALARVHRADGGEGSPRWQAMLLGMEDLLWSVEPKVTADDRKRLINMLPAMLRTLHEALALGELEESRRSAFLGTLVDCHAMAVKAGMRGLALVAESQPRPALREDPAVIEREMIPAGEIQVEEIRLRAPRPGAARNVFTRTGIWSNLQRGTWVEFARDGGGAARARLTWISPNKGVYLFTNPLSPNAAVSISPEALAQQMRLGEAKIIDDASLVDRAVDSMLTNLRADGAAAQG